MPYLFIIGIALSFFFFVLLVTIDNKKTEHHLLSAFFLIASLNVGYLFLNFNQDGELYIPFITEVHLAMPVLYGTIVYFYIKSVTNKSFKIQLSHLIHLGPFVAFLIFISWRIHSNYDLDFFYLRSIVILKPLINAIYLTAALIHLRSFRKNKILNTQTQSANWLLVLCLGGLCFCLIKIVGMIVNSAHPHIAPMAGDYLLGSFTSIFFFVLGLIAFKNSNVFTSVFEIKNQIIDNIKLSKPKARIEKSDFEMLQDIMKMQKPFLNSQLSINDLSKHSNITVAKLSRLINHFGKQNFHDFVNWYRVEEVKTKIASGKHDHLSILGIALESGFNSKASFHRIFKKMTGITPSSYKESISKSKTD